MEPIIYSTIAFIVGVAVACWYMRQSTPETDNELLDFIETRRLTIVPSMDTSNWGVLDHGTLLTATSSTLRLAILAAKVELGNG